MIEIPWIRDHCILPGEPEDPYQRILCWLENYTLDPRQDMGDAHGTSEAPDWLPDKAPAMFPAAVAVSSNFYKLSGTFCLYTDDPRIAAEVLGAILWNMESDDYQRAKKDMEETDARRRAKRIADHEAWRIGKIRELEAITL